MGKIIQFPVDRIKKEQESNGYRNLIMLFEVADTVASCNFYLESAEYLFKEGNITQRELYALRRIGRQKRLKLAVPEQGPVKAEKPGTYTYTPEMGQREPEGCQMEAYRSYYSNHFFIDTPLTLKGRGIKFIRQYKPGDLLTSKKDGWNEYQVTELAFEKLKGQYAIAMERCLD